MTDSASFPSDPRTSKPRSLPSEAQPWLAYEFDDTRILEPASDLAVLTYTATAVRGSSTYRALIASTCVRGDGRWRLLVHQQTPLLPAT